MHSVADFILEAVENSSEAGAGNISVDAVLEDGIWSIRVADDGVWTLEEGKTTSKGEGRGRGLGLIRSGSAECHISIGCGTELVFRAEDDGSLCDCYAAFLPVFLRDGEVSVSIRHGSVSFSTSTSELKRSNAFPDRADSIRHFKALMGSWMIRR